MDIMHEKISKEPSVPYKIVYSRSELGFPIHWHQEIEMIYVLEGLVYLEIDGRKITLHPRDIFLVNSCELHQLIMNTEGNKKFILQLDITAFGPYKDQIFYQRFQKPHLSPEASNTISLFSLHTLLEKHVIELQKEWEEQLPGHELFILARVNDLAADIVRYAPMVAYSTEENIKRLEQVERLDRVFKYIEQNYASDITLAMAADETGLSISYFSRLFKEATGTKFVDYLNNYRVNQAMYLLQFGKMKIIDVAFSTGFNSVENFNRVFKKVSGCIPSEYRNKK
ncbi:MAG: hypothetical protein K0S47_219 [Herbinix sp.]|nr:hypothetical protein [Herbinix sp.]